MKKISILLVLCMVISFASCSNVGNHNETTEEITAWTPPTTEETVTEGTIKVNEQKVQIQNVEETEATEETTELATQGVVNPNGHIPVTTVMGSFDEKDLTFTYKKFSFKVGDTIDSVFAQVGEDNVSQEISSNTMEYTYENFVLYTEIDENDLELLSKIAIEKEGVATSKGVKIGDYASALVRIYGKPVKQEKGKKYYGNDESSLVFYYEDNHITKIEYI